MPWFLAGMLVGLINVLLTIRTVARVQKGVPRLFSRTLQDVLARLGLASLVLMWAVLHSARAALWAFAGLWLARWALVLWLYRKDIPWSWFI